LPVLVSVGLVETLNEAVLSGSETRVVGNAIVVLPRKNTNLERREDGETEANAMGVVVEECEFLLDLLADTGLRN